MIIRKDILSNLPASEIVSDVNSCLKKCASAVITAPPGAGKSTLLPLTILGEMEGRILMLEPRRLAARQIAERMSSMIGEKVGETIGYRIRFDTKVSAQTRIEVLTEGILTKMLVSDPTLDGVSAVIFDEYHERSLASDLALALTRESQKIIRPDLKIVIMSATIDTDAISKALDAPVIKSRGRMYPVETVYCGEDADILNTIRTAHRDHEGDILVFLPGEAEIRKCAEALEGTLGGTNVYPLYGILSPQEQQKAIAPSLPGQRKVVLSTPIAETSLTIEGVRIVVDSGLCRKMTFNSQTRLSSLETVRISKDMAAQRTGRAGRVAPGICYRMWSRGTESIMAENRVPEILEADLTGTVLDVAAWGEDDIQTLSWITPPPAASVFRATSLLKDLGAIDNSGKITQRGRRLAAIPCHPRIAMMLLSSGDAAQKALAADIAAILEEKDPLASNVQDSDISIRLEELRRSRNDRKWARIAKISKQYCDMVKVREDNSSPDAYKAGALIARAYPERIAKESDEGPGIFLLSRGGRARMDAQDSLAGNKFIAIANLNTFEGKDGRIFLAAPLDPEDIKDLYQEKDNISRDPKTGNIVARREIRLGNLTVSSKPIHDIDRSRIEEVICEAAKKDGTSMFDFSDEVGNLQRRVSAVAQWHPELELPSLETDVILERAAEWLPPFLGKSVSASDLKKIDLVQAIWSILTFEQQQAVEKFAPTHIEVPTGSRIRVEYRQGAEFPVLRVRLQECFGLRDTPKVDAGRRPVLMELLSPGFKPVQLTSDLGSFWSNTYFEVRKELRRRYPKHFWPDNPLEAPATRGVKH